MRPSFLATARTQRHPASPRRSRRRHARAAGAEIRTEVRRKAPDKQEAPPVCADPAARQIRAAGGPLDEATYSCQCGYVFAAAVTTSVSCPHCGDTQAW